MARPRVLREREQDALADEEVVRRVRAGQIDLFEVLMRRYNQRVYRIARAVLRTDTEAEDVTQETWVRAYAHLGQFAERAAFRTWLGRIALHESWARARRGRRQESLEPDPGVEDRTVTRESSAADPEKAAFEREVRSLVEAAVEGLPEIYRTVFMLRHVEELSTAETAELLELTEETVKTRLHRARTALRRELLARAGAGVEQAFPFLGARCDRMVASVLARIGGRGPAGAPDPSPN
jgi:RNA polymerase sigma-70 factor, ECF subfamily